MKPEFSIKFYGNISASPSSKPKLNITSVKSSLFEFKKDLWDDSSKPVVNEINECFLRSTKKLPVKVI